MIVVVVVRKLMFDVVVPLVGCSLSLLFDENPDITIYVGLVYD
jgi:hypothetical protein